MKEQIVQTFVRKNFKPIHFKDLTCLPELEVEIDLSENRVIPHGEKSVRLAEKLEKPRVMLTDSMISGNPAVGSYFKDLLARPENCQPIVIKVAENLDALCGRSFDPRTGESTIIFQKAYLDKHSTPGNLASLLFHELGRTRVIGLYQTAKEEYELFKWDLARYLSTGREGTPYPDEYRELLEFVVEHANFISGLEIVIGTTETLERESNTVYRLHKLFQIETSEDAPVSKARNQRIDRAFKTCDQDFPASILSSITLPKTLRNTFLGQFIRILGDRGIAQGRDSFLYLSKNQLDVVPFNQLKNPRVPLGTKGVLVEDQHVEKNRWARQYFSLHKKRRFSDGISVTEAENGRLGEQRWHKHGSTEHTVSLCDHTQLVYGHVLALGEDSAGREIKRIEFEGQQYDIVIDGKQNVPFGHMIKMPPNFFHTLRNMSSEKPSTDFTIKEPVTQLRKDFEPPTVGSTGVVEILAPAKTDEKRWGCIRHHDYGEYPTKLSLDESTGEMIYDFSGDEEIPHSIETRNLEVSIIEVNPGATTDRFRHSSLYPDLQVVHIFPWPREIPNDWVLDRDHKDLQAVMAAYDSRSDEIGRINALGGDLILMDNALAPERPVYEFQLTNKSKHGLLLLVVDAKETLLPASRRDTPDSQISTANSPVVM